MRIGYPCINRSIGCSANRTFRLANYSEKRLFETVAGNLDCLFRILRENVRNGFFFHRISSDLVPFASHPVCIHSWQHEFAADFTAIGKFIRAHGIRISMHPDQFTLLNSPRVEVVERSVAELAYHAEALDLMGLDEDARIQIHVGGAYGDKAAAVERFVERFHLLDHAVRRRLAVENDDRLFTFADCCRVFERVGIPVIFDNLHHAVNSSGEDLPSVFRRLSQLWPTRCGVPMTDYSDQAAEAKPGVHAEHLDAESFAGYLRATVGHDFDIMLEIKDKEKSAAVALAIARREAAARLVGASEMFCRNHVLRSLTAENCPGVGCKAKNSDYS